MFGEVSPAYHDMARVLRGLREKDILLVVGSAMQVIPAERLVPAWRVGYGLNWQVNPEPVDQSYFGRNFKAVASEGLLQLEPLLAQLM